MQEQDGHHSGLLASLRQLAATAVEILHTRVSLIATELDEERAHIARAMWLSAFGAFCLGMGLILAVLFVVVLFWDSHRLLVLGSLAFGFLAAGGVAMLVLRSRVSARMGLFAQSLQELKRDQELLKR